jgi:single-strand DNA-binding protein
MYLNLEIIGNIGNDAEMRTTPAGQAVVNFNVAANRQYNDQAGNKIKETTWVKVTLWGNHATALHQYLKKGKMVFCSGRLNIDTATGGPKIFKKQDGTYGASFDMTADNVRLLGGGNGQNGENSGGSTNEAFATAPSEQLSEIQF